MKLLPVKCSWNQKLRLSWPRTKSKSNHLFQATRPIEKKETETHKHILRNTKTIVATQNDKLVHLSHS